MTREYCPKCSMLLPCQCPEYQKADALRKLSDELKRFNDLFEEEICQLERVYLRSRM
jgi:hypothetical protein